MQTTITFPVFYFCERDKCETPGNQTYIDGNGV